MNQRLVLSLSLCVCVYQTRNERLCVWCVLRQEGETATLQSAFLGRMLRRMRVLEIGSLSVQRVCVCVCVCVRASLWLMEQEEVLT